MRPECDRSLVGRLVREAVLAPPVHLPKIDTARTSQGPARAGWPAASAQLAATADRCSRWEADTSSNRSANLDGATLTPTVAKMPDRLARHTGQRCQLTGPKLECTQVRSHRCSIDERWRRRLRRQAPRASAPATSVGGVRCLARDAPAAPGEITPLVGTVQVAGALAMQPRACCQRTQQRSDQPTTVPPPRRRESTSRLATRVTCCSPSVRWIAASARWGTAAPSASSIASSATTSSPLVTT